jgi:hypothetical protein
MPRRRASGSSHETPPGLARGVSLRRVRRTRRGDGRVVEGLREGAEGAARAGQKPPFCIENRRLEPAMARPLYQTELTRNADSYEADMPVQLVLAAALRNTYRCTR